MIGVFDHVARHVMPKTKTGCHSHTRSPLPSTPKEDQSFTAQDCTCLYKHSCSIAHHSTAHCSHRIALAAQRTTTQKKIQREVTRVAQASTLQQHHPLQYSADTPGPRVHHCLAALALKHSWLPVQQQLKHDSRTAQPRPVDGRLTATLSPGWQQHRRNPNRTQAGVQGASGTQHKQGKTQVLAPW
jgi:hypothetical protein